MATSLGDSHSLEKKCCPASLSGILSEWFAVRFLLALGIFRNLCSRPFTFALNGAAHAVWDIIGNLDVTYSYVFTFAINSDCVYMDKIKSCRKTCANMVPDIVASVTDLIITVQDQTCAKSAPSMSPTDLRNVTQYNQLFGNCPHKPGIEPGTARIWERSQATKPLGWFTSLDLILSIGGIGMCQTHAHEVHFPVRLIDVTK